MRLLFLLPLSFLLFAGCDSDDPIDTGGSANLTCELVGLTSSGSMTASTSSGSFSANCFEVSSFENEISVTGYDIDLSTGEFDGLISVGADGAAPGTYPIDPDEEDPDVLYGGGSFGANGIASLDATAGSVTITESSANRIAGTFSFSTANGSTVSNGQFSVSF